MNAFLAANTGSAAAPGGGRRTPPRPLGRTAASACPPWVERRLGRDHEVGAGIHRLPQHRQRRHGRRDDAGDNRRRITGLEAVDRLRFHATPICALMRAISSCAVMAATEGHTGPITNGEAAGPPPGPRTRDAKVVSSNFPFIPCESPLRLPRGQRPGRSMPTARPRRGGGARMNAGIPRDGRRRCGGAGVRRQRDARQTSGARRLRSALPSASAAGQQPRASRRRRRDEGQSAHARGGARTGEGAPGRGAGPLHLVQQLRRHQARRRTGAHAGGQGRRAGLRRDEVPRRRRRPGAAPHLCARRRSAACRS